MSPLGCQNHCWFEVLLSCQKMFSQSQFHRLPDISFEKSDIHGIFVSEIDVRHCYWGPNVSIYVKFSVWWYINNLEIWSVPEGVCRYLCKQWTTCYLKLCQFGKSFKCTITDNTELVLTNWELFKFLETSKGVLWHLLQKIILET